MSRKIVKYLLRRAGGCPGSCPLPLSARERILASDMGNYGKAYAEAYELQQLLLEDAKAPGIKPGTRALVARAYILLEQTRRSIRAPRLKLQRERRAMQPRANRRGPVAPESMSSVIATSTSPVIASSTPSNSTTVEPSACQPPSIASAPAAPTPAAPAPQAPVDEPSI